MLINTMEVTNQPTNSNDYAVAKALNTEVLTMIYSIMIADVFGLPEDYEVTELNRAYVLLTNELQKLYDRTPELAAIKPEPLWERFDVLKTSAWEINEYLGDPDNDEGKAHIAKIERLCIIAGVETLELSPEQKRLLDYAMPIRKKYVKIIDKVDAENKAKKENNAYVPAYKLTYKPDGTILVNEVLKLKKIHAGSTTERLLEQAIKNPNTLFNPDLGQTSRNISTVLNGAGFTPTLRQLFFPTVSKSKGIFFRPRITREEADSDNIDTTELDLTLKKLGATTEPKSLN
jgi:hypothetical protein